MKWSSDSNTLGVEVSPSPRRAWIEIVMCRLYRVREESPSPRRAWIEIPLSTRGGVPLLSPSPRRAWIEMVSRGVDNHITNVALPTEGVD